METNNKHTAGPWNLQGPKVQEDFGGQTYWTILPNPYKSKADPFKAIGFYYPYSGHSEEEQTANAKLIASSPELLRMLKCFVEAIDIIVDAKDSISEERRQVYVSIQGSETYKQSVEAINQATQ